jgi:hypothetical protein
VKLQRYLESEIFPSCGGRLVHGFEAGNWAPGYMSVLFEDPDGIRFVIFSKLSYCCQIAIISYFC